MAVFRWAVESWGAALLLLALGGVPLASAGSEHKSPVADGSCVSLHADGQFVVRNQLGGYEATSFQATQPFRLQKTGTDTYLLYGTDDDFLGKGLGSQGILSARAAGAETNWRLECLGTSGYKITAASTGEQLVVDPVSKLLKTSSSACNAGTAFLLQPSDGCATAPDAELNVVGNPFTGSINGEVLGLAELHSHLTAYEFIGGDIHCGEPWSPFGITNALVDCPDHQPNGTGAWWENLVGGGYPTFTHDTTGWPTFKDWPKHNSITHEAMYYRWLERAWRGGLRIFTNLFVNNEELCEIYPLKSNPCGDMPSIRLQAQRIYELQDFVDGQSGGEGEGWLRIVDNPAEARQVIEEGKLAVTLGVEVSAPFGCRIKNGVPQCNEADIDAGLDEMYALGVRRMFVCHKFDNALCGVRFDSGLSGGLINFANYLSTGKFWEVETCPTAAQDNTIEANAGPVVGPLIESVLPGVYPPGLVIPVYPAGPHCNVNGLTPLGEHMVRGMIARGMMVDIDHMSVKAAGQTLDLLESVGYPGVISGHSWIDTSFYPRIFALGGMAVPYGSAASTVYPEWKAMKAVSDERYTFGFGAGFDTGGFGQQPPPPNGTNVTYPFLTFDGGSIVSRQRTGERVFDYNVDGLAHYGLLPDWVEDLRLVAGVDGKEIIEDLGRGAEAYIQVWERAST